MRHFYLMVSIETNWFFFYIFIKVFYLILEVKLKGRKVLIAFYSFKNQNMQRNILFPLGFFSPITNLFRALIKAYLFCFNLTQSKQFEAIYSDEEGASINLLG